MVEEDDGWLIAQAQRGHNNPPSMIDTAGDVTAQLNIWMTDNPVIETEDKARDAKILIDRAKLCVKDMEAEREGKVKPLNLKVAEINESYRPSRGLLQKLHAALAGRVTDYLCKEEARRIKIAEEARQKAEEAERAAKDAEQREQEAIDDAKTGAIVDVGAASENADKLYAEYGLAARSAARAEKEARVRIGGGFTRSMSLRNKETLVVTNATDAINAIGSNSDIEAAIIKAARAYRIMFNELPPGIESQIERSV